MARHGNAVGEAEGRIVDGPATARQRRAAASSSGRCPARSPAGRTGCRRSGRPARRRSASPRRGWRRRRLPGWSQGRSSAGRHSRCRGDRAEGGRQPLGAQSPTGRKSAVRGSTGHRDRGAPKQPLVAAARGPPVIGITARPPRRAAGPVDRKPLISALGSGSLAGRALRRGGGDGGADGGVLPLDGSGEAGHAGADLVERVEQQRDDRQRRLAIDLDAGRVARTIPLPRRARRPPARRDEVERDLARPSDPGGVGPDAAEGDRRRGGDDADQDGRTPRPASSAGTPSPSTPRVANAAT